MTGGRKIALMVWNLQIMESSNNNQEPFHAKLITPLWIVVDIVLAVIFFIFMYGIIDPHSTGEGELAIRIMTIGTTFCLTLVFWLALQLFRVTLTDQIRNNNDGTPRQK